MIDAHDVTLGRLARVTLEDRHRRADRRALLRRASADRPPFSATAARLAALARRLASRRPAPTAARPCEACG